MLWTFIQACASGKLPGQECEPLYEIGAIAVGLLVSIVVLTVMVLRRTRAPR